MRALPVLVCLAACSDYDLVGGDDTNDTPDITVPADGVCDVATAGAGTIDVDQVCVGADIQQVEDPWNATLEWQWEVSSSGYGYYWASGVIVMPAVGNLTDDNGDHHVDAGDNPDIAFTTWGTNEAVALRGDGTGVLFEVAGYDGQCGTAIADVDNDGIPEVITATPAHEIVALDQDGNRKWTSAPFPMQMYPQPTVADLDGDGNVEVIVDVGVVDGRTGATIATLNGVTNSWRTPVAADLDADGDQEILLGNQVFDMHGNIQWTNPGTGWGNFAAVADIDGDIGGESMFVSGSSGYGYGYGAHLYIHDDDGTLLHDVTISGSNPGPPSVADFDGDGQVEIAIPANYAISVYEMDGTQDWSVPMQDSSGLAGCSGYDVNGDGAYEVLFADETDFRIYDGKTGAVLYDNTTHNSGTVWEYPVVADVDNDGSAEIIIASNMGEWQGIEVFGHAGDGWPKSGPTWATHDFAVTNVDPDGHVPSPAPLPWTVNNTFRARPAVDVPGLPDVLVAITDVCVTSCDDGADATAQVAYQVSNQGGVRSASVGIALVDVAGTIVDHQTVPSIESGESAPGALFEVPAASIADGFTLVLDKQGALFECDEGNNEAAFDQPLCAN
jgi:hypothetical protein